MPDIPPLLADFCRQYPQHGALAKGLTLRTEDVNAFLAWAVRCTTLSGEQAAELVYSTWETRWRRPAPTSDAEIRRTHT